MDLQSKPTTDMQLLRATAQSRAREWLHFSNIAVLGERREHKKIVVR